MGFHPDFRVDSRSMLALFLVLLLVLSLPATTAVYAMETSPNIGDSNPGAHTPGVHTTESDSTGDVGTSGGSAVGASALQSQSSANQSDVAEAVATSLPENVELQLLNKQDAVYQTYSNAQLQLVNADTGGTISGETLREFEFAAFHSNSRVDHFKNFGDESGDGEIDTLFLQHPVLDYGSEVEYAVRREGLGMDGWEHSITRAVTPIAIETSTNVASVGQQTDVNMSFSDPRENGSGLSNLNNRSTFLTLTTEGVDAAVTLGGTTKTIQAGEMQFFPVTNWDNITLGMEPLGTSEVGPSQINIRTFLDPERIGTPFAEETIIVDGGGQAHERNDSSFEDPCTSSVIPDLDNGSWVIQPICGPGISASEVTGTIINEDTGETVTVGGERMEIPNEHISTDPNTTTNISFDLTYVDLNTSNNGGGPNPNGGGHGGTTIGPPPTNDTNDEDPSCSPRAPSRIMHDNTLTISVATNKIDTVTVTHTGQGTAGGSKTGEVTRWPEIDEPQRASFDIECQAEDGSMLQSSLDVIHWDDMRVRAHLNPIGYDISGINFERDWNIERRPDVDGTYLVDDTVTLTLGSQHQTTKIDDRTYAVGDLANQLAVDNSVATAVGKNSFGDVIYERNRDVPNYAAPTWMNNFLSWNSIPFNLNTDMAAGSSSIDLDEGIQITFLEHSMEEEGQFPAGPMKVYDYDLSWTGDFGYKWPDNDLTAGTEFEGDMTVADLFAEGDISADVELNALPFALDSAEIDGRLVVGKTYGIDSSVPLVGSVEGEAKLGGGVNVELDVGTDWVIEKAAAGPSITAGVEAEATVWGVDVTGTGQGDIDGQVEFDLEPLMSVEGVSISTTVTVGLSTTVWGKEVGGSVNVFDFTCSAPPANCDSNGLIFSQGVTDTTEMTTLGGVGPSFDPPNTWSTNRSYEDTQPSVIGIGGEAVAAYSSQDENKSVAEGRDIVVANSSNRTRVTGAGQFDDNPSLAAGSGTTAIAFRRATTPDLANATVGEVFNSTEIGVLTGDGNAESWSSVTLVTNNGSEGIGALDAAVTDAGNILVAAEVGDTFAGNATTVRWLLLDGSLSTLASGRIQNASAPAVDTNGSLAIYDPFAAEVINGTIDGGSFTGQTAYAAGGYTDHTLSNGSLLILEGTNNESSVYGDGSTPTLRHIADGTVSNISIDRSAAGVDSLGQLDATVVDGQLTVGYLASTPQGDSVWTQERTDDGWTPITNITPAANETLQYLDLGGSQRLASAYTALPSGNDSVHDIYVTRDTSTTEFAIRDTTAIRMGTAADINVTVQNIGGQQGPVQVELLANATDPDDPNTQIDSTTLTLNGSEAQITEFTTVPSPIDGLVTASLNTTTQAGEYVTNETIAIVAPKLWVSDTQLDAGNDTLTVDIRNMGYAPAENVTVTLVEGDTEIASTQVTTLPIGTTNTTLSVSAAALDPTATHEIDINGSLSNWSVSELPHETQLVTPRVALNPVGGDSAVYTTSSGGNVSAFVTVQHYGQTNFTGDLRVLPVENGTVNTSAPVGVRNVTLSAGARTAVEVDLNDSVAPGDELVFRLPDVITENPDLGSHKSTVNTLMQAGQINITSVTPESTFLDVNNTTTMNVSGALRNIGDFPAPGPIELRIDGTTVASLNETLASGANSTISFQNVTFNLSQGLHTVEIVSPTDSASAGISVGEKLPPVVREPPRDLDGDGLYEDIDGDLEFDIFDVQALFVHRQSPEVQNNAWAYNFTGGASSGGTIFDVQSLFQMVVNGTSVMAAGSDPPILAD